MTVKPTTVKEELEKLKAANLRLRLAINATVASWPKVDRCWIDDTMAGEPTALLEKHRIKNGNGHE
jgi:hypothetical protein